MKLVFTEQLQCIRPGTAGFWKLKVNGMSFMMPSRLIAARCFNVLELPACKMLQDLV